jgi:hypothetical protein
MLLMALFSSCRRYHAELLLQGGGVVTRGPDWLKTADGSDLFIDFSEVPDHSPLLSSSSAPHVGQRPAC